MRLSWTLSTYFGRQFLGAVAGMFLAMAAIVLLLDTIELLRRGSTKEEATLGVLVQMALLKLPHMGQLFLPFAILFGGMLAFARMNRHHELVVARSAGVSIWQALLPALLAALAIGIFKIAVFNPLASVLIARYELLESQVLRGRANQAAISETGLWLREATAEGQFVLHAGGTRPGTIELAGVVVFLFQGTDRFAGRLDAATAKLGDGYWLLSDVTVTNIDTPPQRIETYELPTVLTAANIQDSFAPPETMSFWQLPGFIEVLEAAGFSAVRHRLYWHSQLASPLLLCAMVLIAATVSTRMFRYGGALVRVALGLFIGFLLYFLSDLVLALGLSSRVPEVLAAWTPAVVTSLLGFASLLHLEDG